MEKPPLLILSVSFLGVKGFLTPTDLPETVAVLDET